MSTMQNEICEAFRAIDVSEEKALRVAAALATAFTKHDAEMRRRSMIATAGSDASKPMSPRRRRT